MGLAMALKNGVISVPLRPAVAVDDGWKRRLSLPVVQLRKLHEAAAYL